MSIAREFLEVDVDAPEQSRSGVPALLQGWTVLALVGVGMILYMSLVYAGSDLMQGNVQRIFYIHVGAFAGAMVAFGTAVVAGIGYLRTRQQKWDALGLASIEVGLALSLITLVTGMVWARPMWNTWWTWDPRLTSAAIMALTYTAYLMLRAGIENPEKKQTFSAVYAIFAISTVIFTTVIIRIRPDSIHPTVIGPATGKAEGGFDMAPSMVHALLTAMFVYTCLLTPVLIWWRIRLENLFSRIAQLQTEILK
jgi:heme exporter protein C